jgi:tRNA (guanine37-N1)-methyltransferase
MPLRINVVTIFPIFYGSTWIEHSISRCRGRSVEYRLVDLRDYTHDKHRTVDDYPYGGGAGMVMKPGRSSRRSKRSVQGADSSACRLGASIRACRCGAVRGGEELTLLCGHYKDVDQRVADHLATEEISLGDFVLSGGERRRLR